MNIKGLTCYLLLVAAALSAPAFANPGDSSLEDAAFVSIVGGEAVPASSRFARLTVMIISIYGSDSIALCSGTLIGKDTVISAAHCVKNEETGQAPTSIGVMLNPTAGASDDKIIPVTKFRVHPSYNSVLDSDGTNRPVHDISILHLDKPAEGPNALIADLPSAEVSNGSDVVLAGYGRTNPADSNSVGKLYFAWTSASVIHVGAGKSADTQIRLTGIQPCSGDSGGPIFRATATTAVLVGVTSNVMGSCSENGTEMSVAAHLPWIRATAEVLGGSIGP